MYLALFSVVYGSLLTFGQAAALFKILDLENYVAYRAVLNTMNNAAPFICLGFDSAAPVLKKLNPGFHFFWNILMVHAISLLILIFIALMLPLDSKFLPLVLGLASSTSVSGALIVANHHRVEGEITRYFVGVNIVDKSIRTIIILGLAILIPGILEWSITMSLLCFVYVGIIAIQTGSKVRLDIKIFKSHVLISVPYIFAALGLTAVTRMPFYAAYITKDNLSTAKIDIWLLFSLFLLIPVLNKSKVEESKSAGLAPEYIAAMKLSWRGLLKMEILICFGIIFAAFTSAVIGITARIDLFNIILPLMIGMILISSMPNYIHVLCLYGKFKSAINFALLIVLLSAVSYLPMLAYFELKVPYLFITSALIYCSIGCMIARIIKVKISDFWRWREAILLIIFSALVMTAVNSSYSDVLF